MEANHESDAERAWAQQRPFGGEILSPKFVVCCQLDDISLDRLRELLGSVHALDTTDFQDLATAARKLPQWFIDQSPRPFSKAEAEDWLKEWKSASASKQSEMQRASWAPADWLYWMDPRNRLAYLVASSANSLTFASRELMSLNGAGQRMLQVCGINIVLQCE